MQTQSKNYSSFENFDKQSTNSKANLNIKIDQKQALANGLELPAINNTLSSAWGGTYVNDFIDRGRIKRVMIKVMPSSDQNRKIYIIGLCVKPK